MKALLIAMRQHPTLAAWCDEDSEIPAMELGKYTKVLQEENQKEKDELRHVANRTRSSRSKGNKAKKDTENKILLVYPFDTDESVLKRASAKLKELGGDTLGVESVVEDAVTSVSAVAHGIEGDGSGKSSTRTHYITIREEDVERPSPGEFLNDSLVDFWMQW